MNARIVICSAIVVVAFVSCLSAAPPAAIAPFGAEEAKAHQQAWSKHLGTPVELTNSIGMKLVLIPPGEFEMGASEDEIERHAERYRREHPKDRSGMELRRIVGEGPRHKVCITQPYYLGACEVTQEQYTRVMGTMSGELASSADAQRPVGRVSWHLAKEFCQKLNEQPEEEAAGCVYDLPTEAQWEFACRAGTETEFPFGDDEGELDNYAWYRANAKESQDSAAHSHQVGQKRPNAWGLHDMLGNVWEWCSDWYDLEYYANSPLTDPGGPKLTEEQETSHVMRGGKFADFLVWPSKRSCPSDARGPKSWLRTQASATRGFRVLCHIGDAPGTDRRGTKLVERTPVLSPMRTWTDSSGRFTVQAQLVRYQGNDVRLLAANGKTIDLAVDRLSEADQSFLRTTIQRKNERPSQRGDWIELIGPQGPIGIARVGGNIALCGDVRFDPNSKSLTPVPGTGVVAAVTKTRFGGANNLLSKQKFGDCEVQLEFLIGKGSNSGVKLQERYEIQPSFRTSGFDFLGIFLVGSVAGVFDGGDNWAW